MRLVLDEQRRINASGGTATAYFAKTIKKGKAKGKSDDKAKKKYCTHCKFKGHDVSECRKLKREQEAKSGNSTSKASTQTSTPAAKVAAVSEEDTVHLYQATATEFVHKTQAQLNSKDLQRQWIVDSGASRFMCSHRDWFQDRKSVV